MEDGKAVRTVPFDGKRESYLMWNSKFKSICALRQCQQVLLVQDPAMPSDSKRLEKPERTGAEKDPYEKDFKIYTLQQSNALAYAMLTMAITEIVSFNAVSNAKTKNLSQGCAFTAWANLEVIYKSKSNSSQYELEQKFNHCVLKTENKNPDVWFSELEAIQIQLETDFKLVIEAEKLVAHIVFNCHPRIYQTTLSIIKREMNHNKTLSLDEIKKDLRSVYSQYMSGDHKDNRRETVLAGVGGKKTFPKKLKKDCRTCGIKGHKSADCFHNPKNAHKKPPNWKPKETALVANTSKSEDKGTKLKCTYCGKDNHTVDRCFAKERDEKKSARTERESTAIMLINLDGFVCQEGNPSEIAEMQYDQVTGKTKWNKSYASCTWVLDSGSTSHMKFNLDGMYDTIPCVITITVGNKECIKSVSKICTSASRAKSRRQG